MEFNENLVKSYAILEKSKFGKTLESFSSFQWRSSNQLPNDLSETSWQLKSNFRLHNLIHYLKTKSIFSSLPEIEFRCLVDGPGVLRDNLYIDALKAKMSNVPLDVLEQRLLWIQKLENKKEMSRDLLRQWNGNVRYEIKEIRKPIRKVKKFSGWIRSSSSVGSKRPRKPSPEPGVFEWSMYDNLDFYEFLTVGRFHGTSVDITPILTRP